MDPNASTLRKERNDIFPLYQTEMPFFETSSVGVNLAKYKKPITKIIYDGKKAFMDDEEYLEEFTKNLLVSAEDQVRILAEREAKEIEEVEEIEEIEEEEEEE